MQNTRWFAPAIAAGALGCSIGCADTSLHEGESTSAAVSERLEDDVDVGADRLTFDRRARSRQLDGLAAKVAAYEAAYRDVDRMAPPTLRSGSDERDGWVVEQLREKGLRPVILVGGRSAHALDADKSVRTGVRNAYGYLRRATGVLEEGDHVVVTTKPASLAEAAEDLREAGLIARAEGDDDGWTWETSYPFAIADIDLSRTLYERNIGAGIGKVTVRLKDSFLRVNGTLDARAAGRWVRPREASAILTTNLEGQILVEGAFDGAFGTSSGDINLYRRSFDIARVGSFPLTLDFEVAAKCDLAANGRVDAEVGMKVDGSVKAGATYVRDTGFDDVWEPTWPRFERVGPSLTSAATVEGRCGVTATARVHLFDALGPEAVAGTFVAIAASGSSSGASGSARAKMTAGIDASVAGTFKPFGINLGSISTTPYHREWVLFDQPVEL